jgi:hypothetical protein
MKTNDFRLHTMIDGVDCAHFSLIEFENPAGWCMVHPSVVRALEQTRAGLNAQSTQGEVEIIITDSVRTVTQNEALGKRLGWTDHGGIVSRNSYHLMKYGGIAVDFKARYKTSRLLLSSRAVFCVAVLFFDYCKSYDDPHVHGDMRKLVTG